MPVMPSSVWTSTKHQLRAAQPPGRYAAVRYVLTSVIFIADRLLLAHAGELRPRSDTPEQGTSVVRLPYHHHLQSCAIRSPDKEARHVHHRREPRRAVVPLLSPPASDDGATRPS